MTSPCVYILECANGSYYTGSTTDLELRLQQHQSGEGANHTRKHRPVKLRYVEEFERIDDAFYREKQIQGWSRKKKEALILGNEHLLPDLSRNYTQYGANSLPEPVEGALEQSALSLSENGASTSSATVKSTSSATEKPTSSGNVVASIQYASDLHLEFKENESFLRDNPIIPKAKILVLCGDIVPLTWLDKYLWFFEDLSQKFEQVYWVPGNHEYYGSDILPYVGSFKKEILSNVHLVNNVLVEFENLVLICSTLWSHISEQHKYDIYSRLSDFRAIRCGEDVLMPDFYNGMHKQSLDFIQDTLRANTDKTIVVATHHVPTFYNYPEKYRGDSLNEAFATELFPFIEKHKIDYWLFGHHHSNVVDFEMDNTQFCCNQLGYVKYGEHNGFDNRVIEVDNQNDKLENAQ